MLGHWDPNIGHNQWQFLRMVLCILYSCLLVLRLSFFLSFLFLLLFLSRWLFRFSAPRYGVLVLKLEKKGFVRLNAVCTKVDNMMAEANFHLQSWEMLNRVEGFMAWKPGPASPASSKQRRASRRLTTLSRIGASAKWPGIFFFSTIKRLSKLRQHFSHVGFPFSITSLAFSRKLLSAVVLFNSLTTGSKSGNGPMEIDFARHFSYVVVMILCSNCSPFLPLSPGTMVPHKVFGPGRASKVLRWGVQQNQYC